ncbi:MAG: prolyl oligopeptidase family serine peptidase [Spirochaetales bacterium]|nr:prolyl oligopeptidase family serine peptidase [Spirochaetales bacterium]
MKYIFILIFALTLSSFLSAAGSYEAMSYENKDGEKLNYRLHLPEILLDNNDLKSYPLILFFHGSGGRGSDNILPVLGSPKDILKITEKFQVPVIIVVPQCPLKFQWSDIPPNADLNRMKKNPTLPMKLTIEMLEEIIAEYPVDLDRIYAVGFSMGGYAVWEILQRFPDKFAAGIPVCGAGDEELTDLIKDIPIWAFHGEDDTVVSPKHSRTMINALIKSGGDPLYTEYENTGHNSWSRTFSNEEVILWLLDQSR